MALIVWLLLPLLAICASAQPGCPPVDQPFPSSDCTRFEAIREATNNCIVDWECIPYVFEDKENLWGLTFNQEANVKVADVVPVVETSGSNRTVSSEETNTESTNTSSPNIANSRDLDLPAEITSGISVKRRNFICRFVRKPQKVRGCTFQPKLHKNGCISRYECTCDTVPPVPDKSVCSKFTTKRNAWGCVIGYICICQATTIPMPKEERCEEIVKVVNDKQCVLRYVCLCKERSPPDPNKNCIRYTPIKDQFDCTVDFACIDRCPKEPVKPNSLQCKGFAPVHNEHGCIELFKCICHHVREPPKTAHCRRFKANKNSFGCIKSYSCLHAPCAVADKALAVLESQDCLRYEPVNAESGACNFKCVCKKPPLKPQDNDYCEKYEEVMSKNGCVTGYRCQKCRPIVPSINCALPQPVQDAYGCAVNFVCHDGSMLSALLKADNNSLFFSNHSTNEFNSTSQSLRDVKTTLLPLDASRTLASNEIDQKLRDLFDSSDLQIFLDPTLGSRAVSPTKIMKKSSDSFGKPLKHQAKQLGNTPAAEPLLTTTNGVMSSHQSDANLVNNSTTEVQSNATASPVTSRVLCPVVTKPNPNCETRLDLSGCVYRFICPAEVVNTTEEERLNNGSNCAEVAEPDFSHGLCHSWNPIKDNRGCVTRFECDVVIRQPQNIQNHTGAKNICLC